MGRTYNDDYMRGTDLIEKNIVFNNDCIRDIVPPGCSYLDYINNRKNTVQTKEFPYSYYGKKGEGKKLKKITEYYTVDFSMLFAEKYKDWKFNYLDRRVHDAICNLYAQGYRYITKYEVATFLYPKKIFSKELIDRINNSIWVLITTWISADLTKEAKKYGYKYFEVNSMLIHAEIIKYELLTDEQKEEANLPHYPHTPEEVICLVAKPPLLRLWECKKQVQSIPRSLFNNRDYDELPRSKWTEEIIEKLLDEVNRAGQYGQADIIVDNFVKSLHITDKKTRAKMPDRILQVLALFKKHQIIEGYQQKNADDNLIASDNNEDKKVRKITILPKAKNKKQTTDKTDDKKDVLSR